MKKMEDQCKRMRTSFEKMTSTKGPDHESQEPSLWGQIPTPVVLAIYTHLEDVDRVSMARVCKTWHQVFYVPALWRTRSFEFGGRRSTGEIEYDALMKSETASSLSYGQIAIKFAEQFQTSLHHVEINFDLSHGRDAKEIVDDFREFSQCLDGAKLRSISFPYLDVDEEGGQMQKDLLDPLKRLIHNQHSLRKVVINSSYFDLETGLQILKCLAEASAATIEDLSLDCFFLNGLSIYRDGRVLTELQKFAGLSRIVMDYYVLSELLVKTWVTGCPHLSFIYLYADEYVQNTHVISCETWKSLVNSHSKLLVELHAFSFQDDKEMPYTFSPAIPLFNLSWYRYKEGTTEFQLTRTLNHVARYHRTIKHLSLGFVGQFPNLDTTAVQNILSKCTHLLPFQCKNNIRPLTNENSWELSQLF